MFFQNILINKVTKIYINANRKELDSHFCFYTNLLWPVILMNVYEENSASHKYEVVQGGSIFMVSSSNCGCASMYTQAPQVQFVLITSKCTGLSCAPKWVFFYPMDNFWGWVLWSSFFNRKLDGSFSLVSKKVI